MPSKTSPILITDVACNGFRGRDLRHGFAISFKATTHSPLDGLLHPRSLWSSHGEWHTAAENPRNGRLRPTPRRRWRFFSIRRMPAFAPMKCGHPSCGHKLACFGSTLGASLAIVLCRRPIDGEASDNLRLLDLAVLKAAVLNSENVPCGPRRRCMCSGKLVTDRDSGRYLTDTTHLSRRAQT
jgi:hypothetical protein